MICTYVALLHFFSSNHLLTRHTQTDVELLCSCLNHQGHLASCLWTLQHIPVAGNRTTNPTPKPQPPSSHISVPYHTISIALTIYSHPQHIRDLWPNYMFTEKGDPTYMWHDYMCHLCHSYVQTAASVGLVHPVLSFEKINLCYTTKAFVCIRNESYMKWRFANTRFT